MFAIRLIDPAKPDKIQQNLTKPNKALSHVYQFMQVISLPLYLLSHYLLDFTKFICKSINKNFAIPN